MSKASWGHSADRLDGASINAFLIALIFFYTLYNVVELNLVQLVWTKCSGKHMGYEITCKRSRMGSGGSDQSKLALTLSVDKAF